MMYVPGSSDLAGSPPGWLCFECGTFYAFDTQREDFRGRVIHSNTRDL